MTTSRSPSLNAMTECWTIGSVSVPAGEVRCPRKGLGHRQSQHCGIGVTKMNNHRSRLSTIGRKQPERRRGTTNMSLPHRQVASSPPVGRDLVATASTAHRCLADLMPSLPARA